MFLTKKARNQCKWVPTATASHSNSSVRQIEETCYLSDSIKNWELLWVSVTTLTKDVMEAGDELSITMSCFRYWLCSKHRYLLKTDGYHFLVLATETGLQLVFSKWFMVCKIRNQGLANATGRTPSNVDWHRKSVPRKWKLDLLTKRSLNWNEMYIYFEVIERNVWDVWQIIS